MRCDEKERNLVPEKDSAIKQENEIYSTNVCERKREREISRKRDEEAMAQSLSTRFRMGTVLVYIHRY